MIMCHPSCLSFVARAIQREEIENKRVLEIGSFNINGSARSIVELLKPSKYIGIDIKKGKDVDVVCNIEDIIDRFGAESFDVVLTTELLEHVKNWKLAVSNIKRVLKKNGIVIITTRSRGYYYHPDPDDFWRFEVDDIKKIFSDFDIEMLDRDSSRPGIFLKARKPMNFNENNLDAMLLYNIVAGKNLLSVNDIGGFHILWRKKAKLFFQILQRILDDTEKIVFKV